MRIEIVESYEHISLMAAELVAAEISKKADIKIAWPTGGTPIGMFHELCQLYKTRLTDFSGINSFNMDEYVGLKKDDSNSNYYYLKENLYNHVNIDLERTFVPEAHKLDIDLACKEYDMLIDIYDKLDLIILGIGTDGHIAFNMPATKYELLTHCTNLSQKTIEDNSRFFNSIEETPTRAITLGIGHILNAKKIILIASGETKSPVISKFHNSKCIDCNIPASFLWLHDDVIIILDNEAAAYIN